MTVIAGDEPVAAFRWLSFGCCVLFFTFTHAPWEWVVAAPACVIYNLLLYARKTLWAPIVAHAVANGAIFFIVVYGSGRWTLDGAPLDLWYFL